MADEDKITINIKTLKSNNFTISVSLSSSVKNFKEKIQQEQAIEVGLQRLIYQGKLLRDEKTVGSYNIKDGHTVHLVMNKPTTNQPASTPQQSNSTSTSNSSAPSDSRGRGSSSGHNNMRGFPSFDTGVSGSSAFFPFSSMMGAFMSGAPSSSSEGPDIGAFLSHLAERSSSSSGPMNFQTFLSRMQEARNSSNNSSNNNSSNSTNNSAHSQGGSGNIPQGNRLNEAVNALRREAADLTVPQLPETRTAPSEWANSQSEIQRCSYALQNMASALQDLIPVLQGMSSVLAQEPEITDVEKRNEIQEFSRRLSRTMNHYSFTTQNLGLGVSKLRMTENPGQARIDPFVHGIMGMTIADSDDDDDDEEEGQDTNIVNFLRSMIQNAQSGSNSDDDDDDDDDNDETGDENQGMSFSDFLQNRLHRERERSANHGNNQPEPSQNRNSPPPLERMRHDERMNELKEFMIRHRDRQVSPNAERIDSTEVGMFFENMLRDKTNFLRALQATLKELDIKAILDIIAGDTRVLQMSLEDLRTALAKDTRVIDTDHSAHLTSAFIREFLNKNYTHLDGVLKEVLKPKLIELFQIIKDVPGPSETCSHPFALALKVWFFELAKELCAKLQPLLGSNQNIAKFFSEHVKDIVSDYSDIGHKEIIAAALENWFMKTFEPNWEKQNAQNWNSVMKSDQIRQELTPPQIPFSDSYTQGSVSKKHKAQNPLSYQKTENLLSSMVERAINSSNAKPKDPRATPQAIAEHISQCQDMNELYLQLLKEDVAQRVHLHHVDYTSESYPNTAEYFFDETAKGKEEDK